MQSTIDQTTSAQSANDQRAGDSPDDRNSKPVRLASGAVLFVCSENAIRSPMASALSRKIHGASLYSRSAGLRHGNKDMMAIEVMREINLNLSQREPRSLRELADGSFDLVIALSDEARSYAQPLAEKMLAIFQFWSVSDPSLVEGSREQRLDAYRATRDELAKLISQQVISPSNYSGR